MRKARSPKWKGTSFRAAYSFEACSSSFATSIFSPGGIGSFRSLVAAGRHEHCGAREGTEEARSREEGARSGKEEARRGKETAAGRHICRYIDIFVCLFVCVIPLKQVAGHSDHTFSRVADVGRSRCLTNKRVGPGERKPKGTCTRLYQRHIYTRKQKGRQKSKDRNRTKKHRENKRQTKTQRKKTGREDAEKAKGQDTIFDF